MSREIEKVPAAGLIYGPHPHHLDHVATLCIILDIPLFVTEPSIEEEANRYYPQLVTFYVDSMELSERLTRFCQVIFSSLPKDLFDQIFFVSEHLLKKKLLNIWIPHGNSDKGHSSYFMEGLAKEKIVLVYGQKMIDFFIEKKVYSQLYAAIILGNYRYEFYREHAPFYDKIVQEHIFDKMPRAKHTVLYAPTWGDAEQSSSLSDAWPHLVKGLPPDWNLILKPHPNALHKLHEVEEHPNICILRSFSPIHPLLKAVDIYLGDMSSIGYDCLTFQKPMFFLNQNHRDLQRDKGLYLFRCGTSINPEDYSAIFSVMQTSLPDDTICFQKVREEVYTYVFGEVISREDLKQTIISTYKKYLEDELHIL